MDVLILLLFVSLMLVLGGVLLFARAITSGDFEHGDRLALLPLEDEGEDEKEAGEAAPRLAPRPPRAQEEIPQHE